MQAITEIEDVLSADEEGPTTLSQHAIIATVVRKLGGL